jgi:CheY-like chemotaxis protein
MRFSRESPVANEANLSPERAGATTRPRPFILVVDDEPNIVELLVLALEDEGYHVDRAYDGEQAWRLVRQHQPDLIISDISMPRLNGLDLFDRLQERRQLARIPVILMSAVRRTVDRPGALFVSKPFDLGGLLDLVQAELAIA